MRTHVHCLSPQKCIGEYRVTDWRGESQSQIILIPTCRVSGEEAISKDGSIYATLGYKAQEKLREGRFPNQGYQETCRIMGLFEVHSDIYQKYKPNITVRTYSPST